MGKVKIKTKEIGKKDLLKGSLVEYLYSKYDISESKPSTRFVKVSRYQK